MGGEMKAEEVLQHQKEQSPLRISTTLPTLHPQRLKKMLLMASKGKGRSSRMAAVAAGLLLRWL